MPRGVKGSGKAKPTTVAKKAVKTKPEEVVAVKTRKPYPSCDERIALADKQIVRLTKLNADRAVLIEKTEKTLAERKAALNKSAAMLERVTQKKERLIAIRDKPTKAPAAKKTPEEKAAEKAAKKAEQEKYEALIAALKSSGKSVDELLAELKGE